MKLKNIAIIFSLVLLLSLCPFYSGHKLRVEIQTDSQKTVPVSLEWKRLGTDKIYHHTKNVKQNGRVSFTIPYEKITYLHLDAPVKITTVKIRGKNKTNLSLNEKQKYENIFLKGRFSFNFYKFFLFLLTISYFYYFLLYQSVPVASVQTGRIMNIEFLRFVFCCEVVYQHLAEQLNLFTKSWLSVEFFFILSGFLMIKGFKREQPVWEVLKKKALRFWPVLIFGVLLVACVVPGTHFWEMMNDVLFLPSTGLSSDGLNIPDWYISVLMWVTLFYLLLLKTVSEKYHTLIVALLVFSAASIFFQHQYAHARITLPNTTYSLGILRGIMGMGIGYFIYLLHQKTKDIPTRSKTMMTLLESAVFVGCLTALHSKHSQNIWIVASFAVLILLFVQKRGRLSEGLDRSFSSFLGRYTFAIYMTHDVFARRILPVLRDRNELITQYPGLTLICFYSVIFILGAITWHVIERKGFPYKLFGLTRS